MLPKQGYADAHAARRHDSATLVRGMLTAFELAKAQKSTVAVDLPLGWKLEVNGIECTAAADEDADVAAGLSFSVHLPSGVEVRSWSHLRQQLHALQHGMTQSKKAPPTYADEAPRRGSRKRLRPLEYWANERA